MTIKQLAKDCDNRILEVLEYKYRNEKAKIRKHIIKQSAVCKIKIQDFVDLYKKQTIYERDVKKLIYLLMDVKIQLYYLTEVDIGLYNHLIYNKGMT